MIPQHIEPEIHLRARLADEENQLTPADRGSIQWALDEINRLRSIVKGMKALDINQDMITKGEFITKFMPRPSYYEFTEGSLDAEHSHKIRTPREN